MGSKFGINGTGFVKKTAHASIAVSSEAERPFVVIVHNAIYSHFCYRTAYFVNETFDVHASTQKALFPSTVRKGS
jgi:hypothetical protein